MKSQEEANKALVVEAFDTLFNKRDYAAAEKFWSPQYIQHSAHIGPGKEGLFDLIKNTPATLKWEHGIILAEDDYVIVHSRYSGNGLPAAWIVADIVRIKDGILRTLGRHSGRGDKGTIKEWQSDVWSFVSISLRSAWSTSDITR